MIPSKKNRLVPLDHDTEIDKEGNHIERGVNGLKRFWAVATRFDKRAANYYHLLLDCCPNVALTINTSLNERAK